MRPPALEQKRKSEKKMAILIHDCVSMSQVAAIKNRWLAKRFGQLDETFPVVFQFERKKRHDA